jgi:hypothetical protein
LHENSCEKPGAAAADAADYDRRGRVQAGRILVQNKTLTVAFAADWPRPRATALHQAAITDIKYCAEEETKSAETEPGHRMNFSIPIASAILGVILLFFGRKLFWLCVAAIGFAAGLEVAPHLFHSPSTIFTLILALFLGLAGALLAVFLQKIAIAVAGFLTGGKLAAAIAATFFVQHANYAGITFLIGGVIGALLLLSLFDWALIIVSSIVGAHLLQSAISLPASGSAILFVVLAIAGMIVQAAFLRGKRAA